MSHLQFIFSFQRCQWPNTQANLYVSLRLQTVPLKLKKNQKHKHKKPNKLKKLEIWLDSVW